MNIIGWVILLISVIIGMWLAYQYIWKNEDYKGRRLNSNVLNVLLGNEPIPTSSKKEDEQNE